MFVYFSFGLFKLWPLGWNYINIYETQEIFSPNTPISFKLFVIKTLYTTHLIMLLTPRVMEKFTEGGGSTFLKLGFVDVIWGRVRRIRETRQGPASETAGREVVAIRSVRGCPLVDLQTIIVEDKCLRRGQTS